MRNFKLIITLLLLVLAGPSLAEIELKNGVCELEHNQYMIKLEVMMNPTGNSVGLMTVDDGRYDPMIRAYNLEKCKFIATGDLERSSIKEKLVANKYVMVNAQEVLSPALNALVTFEKQQGGLDVRYQYNSPEEQQSLKQMILYFNLRTPTLDVNSIYKISHNKTLLNAKFKRALFKSSPKNLTWSQSLAFINLYAAAYNKKGDDSLKALLKESVAEKYLNEAIVSGVQSDNLQNPVQIISRYLQPIKNMTQNSHYRYKLFEPGIAAAVSTLFAQKQQKNNGMNFYMQYQQVADYAQKNLNYDIAKSMGKLFLRSADYQVLAQAMSNNLFNANSISRRADFKLLRLIPYKIRIYDYHDHLELRAEPNVSRASAKIVYKHPVACRKTVLNKHKRKRTTNDGTIYAEVLDSVSEYCELDNSTDGSRFIHALSQTAKTYGFEYSKELPSSMNLGRREFQEVVESVEVGVDPYVRKTYEARRLGEMNCQSQRGQCLAMCEGISDAYRSYRCKSKCREIACY